MIFEEVKNKLINWMIDFVEVPNPNLGDWAPCPYAKQARIQDKIAIKFAHDITETVYDSLSELESKDVVVICFDHTIISPGATVDLVEKLNIDLMKQDIVILEDHPEITETINNVPMNFGYSGLLIIQRLSKLNEASDQLHKSGYYSHWNNEETDFVVSWRRQ